MYQMSEHLVGLTVRGGGVSSVSDLLMMLDPVDQFAVPILQLRRLIRRSVLEQGVSDSSGKAADNVGRGGCAGGS